MAEPRLAAAAGAQGARVDLTRAPSVRSRFEVAIRVGLFAAAALSVVTTLAIVGSLLVETVRFFGTVPIGDYLFGTKWTPQFAGDQQSFGVIPLVWGTLYLTGIGLLVAIPVGILSGMYLSEFALRRVRKTIKPILEVLAGVPTIVFGYFGFSYYEGNQDKLNLVGVGESADKCVKPSTETIQDSSYYLARPLFMYPSDKALARPEVAAFMKFVVENYQPIAEAAKIVPMTDEQASESKSEVDSLAGS